MKKTAWVFLVALAASTSFAGEAEAERFAQKTVAGWNTYAVHLEDDNISYCTARRKLNGADVGFSMSNLGGFEIMITNDAWGLREGNAYAAEVSVDDRFAVSKEAETVDSGFIVSFDETANRALSALKRGYNLVIDPVNNDTRLSYPLDGTARALTRLERCYTKHVANDGRNPFAEQEESNPFSGGSASTGSSDILAPIGQDDIQTLRSVFQAAGVPISKVRPARDVISKMEPMVSHSWKVYSPRVYGGYGRLNTGIPSLETAAEFYRDIWIDGFDERCQGTSSTELVRTASIAGGTVARFRGICRFADSKTVSIEGIVLLSDSGIVDYVAHIGAGSQQIAAARKVSERLMTVIEGTSENSDNRSVTTGSDGLNI